MIGQGGGARIGPGGWLGSCIVEEIWDLMGDHVMMDAKYSILFYGFGHGQSAWLRGGSKVFSTMIPLGFSNRADR